MTWDDALLRMLRSLEGLESSTDPNYVFHFALAAGVIGLASVVLDLCYLSASGKSFLNLKHGSKSTALFFVTWPLGACLFGWFGLALHILQPSVLGAVVAGVTWNLAVAQLTSKIRKGVDPEEDPGGEES